MSICIWLSICFLSILLTDSIYYPYCIRSCKSIRDRRFGYKVGQIRPKWDKSGTFSDQISVHFGSASQNVLKSDLKKSRICLIWSTLGPNLISLIWAVTHLLSCQIWRACPLWGNTPTSGPPRRWSSRPACLTWRRSRRRDVVDLGRNTQGCQFRQKFNHGATLSTWGLDTNTTKLAPCGDWRTMWLIKSILNTFGLNLGRFKPYYYSVNSLFEKKSKIYPIWYHSGPIIALGLNHRHEHSWDFLGLLWSFAPFWNFAWNDWKEKKA